MVKFFERVGDGQFLLFLKIYNVPKEKYISVRIENNKSVSNKKNDNR